MLPKPWTSPRLHMAKPWIVLYVLACLGFSAGAVVSTSAFIRFGCVVFLMAFAFQFWTVATAWGERLAFEEEINEAREENARPPGGRHRKGGPTQELDPARILSIIDSQDPLETPLPGITQDQLDVLKGVHGGVLSSAPAHQSENSRSRIPRY